MVVLGNIPFFLDTLPDGEACYQDAVGRSAGVELPHSIASGGMVTQGLSVWCDWGSILLNWVVDGGWWVLGVWWCTSL